MSANPRQVLVNTTNRPMARHASVLWTTMVVASLGLATVVGCAHTQTSIVNGTEVSGVTEPNSTESNSTELDSQVLGVVRFRDRDLVIHPGDLFSLRDRDGALLLEVATLTALRDVDPILAAQIDRMRASNVHDELDASIDVDLLSPTQIP